MATELLARAADIVQANGFVRGQYFADQGSGRPAAKCPVCPRGAIAIAADMHPLFAVEWPLYCAPLEGDGREPGSVAERNALAEIITAEDAFARYLRTEQRAEGPDDTSLIENWADEPGRTLPQVIGALRAAAEYQSAGA